MRIYYYIAGSICLVLLFLGGLTIAQHIKKKKKGIPIRFCEEFGNCVFKSRIVYLTQPIYIGRKKCEIILKGKGIEDSHACIYLVDGVLYIEDQNTKTGTYLGGMRIVHPNRLRSNDIITIGDCQFRLLF